MLQVKQSESQHVLYQGTAQLASPYKVEQQTTEVRLLRWLISWLLG